MDEYDIECCMVDVMNDFEDVMNDFEGSGVEFVECLGWPDKGRVSSCQFGIAIPEGPVGEGTFVGSVVGIERFVCRTSNMEDGSTLGFVPMHCGPGRTRRDQHG